MGEHDPLRLAGASRSVLQERQIAAARPQAFAAGLRRQLGRSHDGSEVGQKRLQQPADLLHLLEGHEHRGLRVGHDAHLPANVLLKSLDARRRIERHRHAGCHQSPHECLEVRTSRGEHDRHRPARFDVERAQPRGHPPRARR